MLLFNMKSSPNNSKVDLLPFALSFLATLLTIPFVICFIFYIALLKVSLG